MSTPNPLIPQGSLQNSGNSNVRIAVATIVAIHVVFFGGLLLQGCKRDANMGANTNAPASNSITSTLTYPPKLIDTNSLYYPSTSSLPADSSSTTTTLPSSTTTVAATQSSNQFGDFSRTLTTPATKPATDPWKQSNAGSTTTAAAPQETIPGKEYTVVRNDTYAKIAKVNGTTVSALKAANPTVDPAKIRPGMKLTVPARAGGATTPIPDGGAAGGPSTGSGNYTVKSGDTLTKIAKAHGLTVGQLREANNLKTSRVNVGQKLKIPAGASTKSTPATAGTNLTF